MDKEFWWVLEGKELRESHLNSNIISGYRKDPVRSDTPGQRSVCARTFAPLLVNLRIRFQPCTPPPFTYRVPVTISAPVSICFLNSKRFSHCASYVKRSNYWMKLSYLIKLGRYFGCKKKKKESREIELDNWNKLRNWKK